MANRTFTDPSTKKKFDLPPNLYPYSTTKSDMYGKWIYKHPDGKRTLHKCVGDELPSKISVALAVELAEALNKKHYSSKFNIIESPQVKKSGYVPYEVAKYIAYHEKTYARFINKEVKGKNKKLAHWQNNRTHLLRFADSFGTVKLHELDYKKVRSWWMNPDNFTRNSQQKTCSTFFKMFDHFCLDDARFVLLFSRGGARLPVHEKLRNRLKASEFEAIRKLALDDGETYLVNAMDIALLTMLRRGNVANLQFADIVDDKLEVELIKKSVKTTFVFDLKDDSNKALLNVVTRCRLARFDVIRASVTEPATNLVHKSFVRPKTGSKDHPTTITPDYLSKGFKKYRDLIKDDSGELVFKNVPANERPTFHEIRSLGCFTALKNGSPIEVVSLLMGHDDIATTKAFYAEGHEDKVVEAHCLNEGVAA